MNAFNTEHLIVYTFLAGTLLLGLWSGTGIKNIREYAIANKMYGTGVLAITFLATFLSGQNTINIQNTCLNWGIIIGLNSVGIAIMFIYSGAFIVPKMMRFYRCITLGDMMHELYGVQGGIITGILGGVYTIALVGVQLIAIGYICENLLGWRKDWSIGIGGAILILYASWGGVKSVTTTDVLQFIVFVIAIPLIANVAISEVGGIKELFRQVPVDKLTISPEHKKFPYFFFNSFLAAGLFPNYLSAPSTVQRILMARSRQQAANMFYITAAASLVVRVLIILTCLAVLVLVPNIKPSRGGAFFYIINHYFSPVMKGLSAAGLLAIVMSSIDSFLNSGGLLVTRNVLKPYFDKVQVKFSELDTVRSITFLIGCASIIAALIVQETSPLVKFALYLFTPVITTPFVAGVLGLKTDTRTFLIASAVTIAFYILTKLGLPRDLNYLRLPIGIVVNAISFFGAHIIKNQGIARVKRQKEESELQPTNPQVSLYIVFALLMCFNYMLPYYMYTGQGEGAMFVIRLIGAVLCVGLLLKPYWKDWSQKYFPSYWRFTLLYCLPFSTTILYALNGGGIEWGINVALTIMLLAMLADWRNFVIISLAGVVLGVLCAYGIKGHIPLSYESLSILARTSIVSAFIGLIFLRSKWNSIERQQKMLRAENAATKASLLQIAEERDKALKTLQNTGIQSLLQVAKDLQGLPVTGEVAQKLHDIEVNLIPKAFQLQNIDTRAQKYLRLQVDTVTIDQLLAKVREKLKENGITHPIRCQQATKRKELVCDPERLATLISKSIAVLQKQLESLHDEEKDPILLGLEDTELHYPLPDVEEGYIKKVKAWRIAITAAEYLPALAPSYEPDLATVPVTEPATTTQELEQLDNERIVKAHYGHAEAAPNTFFYVIPRKLRKVRPKYMDKSYMEFGAAPVRANDLYKSDTIDAQAQEKEFLAAVEQRSSADIGLVKMALELIKWYHGPAFRHSGEPFYLHPLAVAQIVLDYNTDEPTILGALLHDTVEDTPMLLPHIETVFGAETAAVVDVVTHLQSLGDSPYKIKLSEEENLQMLSRIGNTRALYVKIADRLHNMRTIYARPYERQLHRAQVTLDFFVPLAAGKLNLPAAAKELKERSLAVLSNQRAASS